MALDQDHVLLSESQSRARDPALFQSWVRQDAQLTSLFENAQVEQIHFKKNWD